MLLAPSPALADKTCTDIDEPTFRGLVLQSQAAIDRGDAVLQREILNEISAVMPCLTFSPPPRLWADYLVSVAIGEFASRGEWQPWMTTALHIRPMVDRGVSSAHPLSKWEPEPVPEEDGGPVPPHVILFVDGLPATRLPPPSGVHLVQRRDGKWWKTLVLINSSPSQEWLETPAEGPPRIIWRGDVGLGLMARSSQQLKPDFTSDFIDDSGREFYVFAAVRGMTTFYSRFGVAGELRHPLALAAGLRPDFRLAAIASSDRALIGPGIGVASINLFQGGTRSSSYLLYPHVVASIRGEGSNPWDIGTAVGARSQLVRLQLYGGVPLNISAASQRWRLSGDITWVRAVWRQDTRPNNVVNGHDIRVSMMASVRIGEP